MKNLEVNQMENIIAGDGWSCAAGIGIALLGVVFASPAAIVGGIVVGAREC